MPFDLRPLFTLSFWLDLDPQPISGAMAWVLLSVFVLVVAAGITVRVTAYRAPDRYLKETFGRVGRMLVTLGLAAVVWFFFHFEQIRFFGARFWLLFWFAGAVLWTVWILRFVRRDVPALKQRDQARRNLDKYLPRKRK